MYYNFYVSQLLPFFLPLVLWKELVSCFVVPQGHDKFFVVVCLVCCHGLVMATVVNAWKAGVR